jgi:spore germination protein
MAYFQNKEEPIMRSRIIVVCLIVFTLTGCVPSTSIEDIMLVEAIGYDYKNKNEIEATAAATIYGSGEGGGTSKTEAFTGSSQTSKDIQRVLQAESPQPIGIGKLKVALYSEKLAEKGIFSYIDSLGRDARIGRLLYIGVVEGKAQDLLTQKYEASETVSLYLLDLMEQNMKENLPKFNFHDFFYSLHGKGMDPFGPLVKRKDDKIKITGLALFDDDRYIDSISFRDCFVFKMLFESFKNGLYQIKMGESYAEIQSIHSKVKYKVENGNGRPVVKISVNMRGVVEEVGGMNLKGKESLKKLEKTSGEQLEEDALRLIRRFQQKGIDPLRMGDKARHQTRGWSEEKWNQAYPDAQVDVDIKVNIVEMGVRE